jgi:hypothetical protein
MGYIVEYVNTLKYANVEHTMINMIVKFAHLNEPIPFTASLNDSEAHGVDLYNRAVNGEFGPIAEYEPIAYTTKQLAALARQRRDVLLKESDFSQLPDIPQATSLLWVPYRQALRDVPQQPGFPSTIDWPTQPN